MKKTVENVDIPAIVEKLAEITELLREIRNYGHTNDRWVKAKAEEALKVALL